MSMIIDGTNGLTFNNATTQARAGIAFQAVQATSTGTVNTTSATYVTTGLTATITPKFSNSKILININGNLYGNGVVTIYRNSTDLCSTAQGFMASSATNVTTASWTYLDSPATTSATTYTAYIKTLTGGSPWWNINSSQCVIVLTEIAG